MAAWSFDRYLALPAEYVAPMELGMDEGLDPAEIAPLRGWPWRRVHDKFLHEAGASRRQARTPRRGVPTTELKIFVLRPHGTRLAERLLRNCITAS